jgi:hypothetical protein
MHGATEDEVTTHTLHSVDGKGGAISTSSLKHWCLFLRLPPLKKEPALGFSFTLLSLVLPNGCACAPPRAYPR